MDLTTLILAKKMGGGGTSNYNSLNNKPQINSVTLQGNKSSADLSLVDDVAVSIDSQNVMTLQLKSGNTIIATATATIITTSVLQSAYFDQTTNELVLEFSNGQTLRFNMANIIGGLLPMTMSFTLEAASWVADGSNYTYDLTTAINTILGQIPVYTAVDPTFTAVTPEGTENPAALHWCELLSGGSYILTEDTTVDTSKTYYSSSQVPSTLSWYEKDSSGNYNLSSDTYVNPSKTYFTRSGKALNGTYKFDISADSVAQGIMDAGTATQICFVTKKVSGTWKLYAVALNGKPSAQITLPVTMVVVSPTVTDMTLQGVAIYKSVGSVPAGTMTFTNKTFDAEDASNTLENVDATHFASDALSDVIKANGKILELQIESDKGLVKTSNGLGHSNSVTAQSTQKIFKTAFDAQGHITGATEATGVTLSITYTDATTETKTLVEK